MEHPLVRWQDDLRKRAGSDWITKNRLNSVVYFGKNYFKHRTVTGWSRAWLMTDILDLLYPIKSENATQIFSGYCKLRLISLFNLTSLLFCAERTTFPPLYIRKYNLSKTVSNLCHFFLFFIQIHGAIGIRPQEPCRGTELESFTSSRYIYMFFEARALSCY